MDRSFLSADSVVAASREFVCIRLATYEDEREAQFLKTVFLGRSGQLENTVFCLLSPDGKRMLSRPGRGPSFAFRDAAEMAAGMIQSAAEYPSARRSPTTKPRLPLMKNLDLALNVASCDNIPLIVTLAGDQHQLAQLDEKLALFAWSKEFAGQFVYASVREKTELNSIDGNQRAEGILVVDPGPFGLSGKTLLDLPPDAGWLQIEQGLRQILSRPRPEPMDPRSHISLGMRMGIQWRSAIPVTDPQSLRAKAQARHRH
jgi:hypothetical protein